MPHLQILKLKRNYEESSWLAKFFLPRKLRAALKQYRQDATDEASQALNICKMVLNNPWPIQRWFYSLFFGDALEEFFRSDLVTALDELNREQLLQEEVGLANFNVVALSNYPCIVAKCLVVLNTYGLLGGDNAQNYREALASYNRNTNLYTILSCQQTTALLQGSQGLACFNAIVKSQDPNSLVPLLIQLDLVGILSEANCTKINAFQTNGLQRLTTAITELQNAHLWTKEAAQASFNGEQPIEFAQCLLKLNQLGISTQNLGFSPNPMDLHSALTILEQNNLLTGAAKQANFDAVVDKRFPEHVADCLIKLSRFGLLTDKNRQIVAQYPRSHSALLEAMFKLSSAQPGLGEYLCTQANFDIISASNDPHITVNELLASGSKTTVVSSVTRHNPDVLADGAAAVDGAVRKISSVNPATEGIFRGKPPRQCEYTPFSLKDLNMRYTRFDKHILADLNRILTNRCHSPFLKKLDGRLLLPNTNGHSSKDVVRVKRLIVMLLAALDDREVKKDDKLFKDFEVNFVSAVKNFYDTKKLADFSRVFDELLKKYFKLPTSSNQAGASVLSC